MLRLRHVVKGLFAMIRNLLIFLMISMSGSELIAQSVNTGQLRRLSGDILTQVEIPGMVRYWEPIGYGWYEFRTPEGMPGYSKPLSRVDSCLMMIEIYPIDYEFESEQDFLDFLRQTLPRDNDPRRFSNYQERMELVRSGGPFLVGHSFSTFDRFWSFRSGQPCTLKARRLIYLHPNKQWIIKAEVSERGPAPFFDPILNYEMDVFMNSLEFSTGKQIQSLNDVPR